MTYWNRAAVQGYHIARLKLGDYYYYGYGTQVDYEQAAYHYKFASEVNHNPQAMFNLAYMHENGLGLMRDAHLAKRFYDMASETSPEAYIPVSLALMKLYCLYYLEGLNKLLENVNLFGRSLNFEDFWDIYLISVLTGIISFLYYFRRR